MLVALLMHERCFLFCGKELLPFLLSEYLVSSKALLNEFCTEAKFNINVLFFIEVWVFLPIKMKFLHKKVTFKVPRMLFICMLK